VAELVAAQRRHRNQPGGYWVAGAKPAAAYEAVAGSLPRSLITRAALLSDGALAWWNAMEPVTGAGC
jgi:hypothetical protein